MATIQLHGNRLSPFTHNVMACFSEKEIDYEFVNVDFSTGAQKEPPFLALDGSNLLGKTLRERALVEKWSQVESQTFSPSCGAILVQIVFGPMFGGKTDQAIVDTNVEKLGKVLYVYEERLSKSEFLAGDFFSVADLSHLSFVNCLVNVAGKGDLIVSRKNVKAWWERISSRPAWKKVLEETKALACIALQLSGPP